MAPLVELLHYEKSLIIFPHLSNTEMELLIKRKEKKKDTKMEVLE